MDDGSGVGDALVFCERGCWVFPGCTGGLEGGVEERCVGGAFVGCEVGVSGGEGEVGHWVARRVGSWVIRVREHMNIRNGIMLGDNATYRTVGTMTRFSGNGCAMSKSCVSLFNRRAC